MLLPAFSGDRNHFSTPRPPAGTLACSRLDIPAAFLHYFRMILTPPLHAFGPEFAEYIRDESRRSGHATAIALPRNEDEIRHALAVARQHGWPVTPQGARTGIAAGAVPEGGLVLNLSRMTRIGAVQPDHRVTVEPGVVLTDLQAALHEKSLFFPPDPTERSASLGGMLACNASGALSYLYGPTRRWVRSLRVVLADGDTLHLERGMKASGRHLEVTTGSGRRIVAELPSLAMPAVKSAAGYSIQPDMDLMDLFIGMEGTLGILVQAELQTLPLPACMNALTAFFPDEAGALRFVRFLRDPAGAPLPCPPAAIEFFDARALDLLRQAKAGNPAFAKLPALAPHFHTAIYVEFHGRDPAAVEESVMQVAEHLQASGAREDDTWFAGSAREIEAMKDFRHATPEAVNLLIDQRKKQHPALTKLGTDMSVPDAALERVMALYHQGLAGAGLEYVIFGHIGNNHVHVNILPRDMDDYDRGKSLYQEWARAVVAMGGSVSAEHGIGKIKPPLLLLMYGADGIAAMRQLKKVFDPEGRLNPGTLF